MLRMKSLSILTLRQKGLECLRENSQGTCNPPVV